MAIERDIEYRQISGMTVDEEVRLLGGAFAFVLSRHPQKKGARDGEKELTNDPAKGIIPHQD